MDGPPTGGAGTPEDPLSVAHAITGALIPTRDVDPVDQVVHTTLEVLAEEGTAGVTFEAVAARAGVSVQSLAVRFADVDELVRHAFERSGEGLRELVGSAASPDDAVHLILPALTLHAPYAQAFARVVLDRYGLDTVQRSFPLADHLVEALGARRDERGAGPVDPRVAAAAIVTLSLSWHFNGDFLSRAYRLDDLDEVEVRRQLSTVLETVVALVSGPRLS